MSNIEMTKEELQSALDLLGVKYHHNAKLETLHQLFVEHKGESKPKVSNTSEDRLAHLRLKRYRIACMNPLKKDWKGEIFKAGNDVVGSVSKFIPYNSPAAASWYIPDMLVEVMRERKYIVTTLERESPTSPKEIITSQWVNEFTLIELPPLTPEEMKRLAKQQAVANLGIPA